MNKIVTAGLLVAIFVTGLALWFTNERVKDLENDLSWLQPRTDAAHQRIDNLVDAVKASQVRTDSYPPFTTASPRPDGCVFPVTVESSPECILIAFVESGYYGVISNLYPASYTEEMRRDPSSWLKSHPFLMSENALIIYNPYFKRLSKPTVETVTETITTTATVTTTMTVSQRVVTEDMPAQYTVGFTYQERLTSSRLFGGTFSPTSPSYEVISITGIPLDSFTRFNGLGTFIASGRNPTIVAVNPFDENKVFLKINIGLSPNFLLDLHAFHIFNPVVTKCRTDLEIIPPAHAVCELNLLNVGTPNMSNNPNLLIHLIITIKEVERS